MKRALFGEDANHWYRAGVILWTILLVVVAFKCLLKPNMHSVYPSYALTARVNWGMDGATHSVSSAYISRQYGPVFGDLLAPFAYCSDRVGGLIWSVANLLCLVLGVRCLAQEMLGKNGSSFKAKRNFGILLCLLPWFGLASLYNGQLNIAITACLLWGMLCCVWNRWWIAALLFAFPTAIKVYPIAFVLVFILLFPRQLGFRFATVLGGLLLLPCLFHSPSEVLSRYEQWFRYLTSGEHYTLALVRVDIRSFVERWIGPFSSIEFLPIQMASGLLLAIVVAFRQRCNDDRHAVIFSGYSLCSLWLVAFGPATEEATYLLAGPALALFFTDRLITQGLTVTNGALLMLGAIAGPLQTSILGETVRRTNLDWKCAPIALLLLFLYVLGSEMAKCRRAVMLPRFGGASTVPDAA